MRAKYINESKISYPDPYETNINQYEYWLFIELQDRGYDEEEADNIIEENKDIIANMFYLEADAGECVDEIITNLEGNSVNENYPMGAKEDPSAPYNQSDGYDDVEIDVNNYGEIELDYIDRNEKESIDPYKFDHYIADRENIPIEEIDDNEGIQILGIETLKVDNYIFQTNMGKFQISLSELESLL